MPSVTTFIEAVNEVLAAAGFPEMSSGGFSAAVGPQRRAKRIVVNCFDDLANGIPDQHWHHMSELTVRKVFKTGTVTDISGTTVTVTGVDLTTALEGAGGYVSEHCLFNMSGGTDSAGDPVIAETQWLKILSVTDTTHFELRTAHPSYPAATPFSGSQTYRIWQWRYEPPGTNFRDVQDAYRPFDGVDMEPMGINTFIRRVLAPRIWEESTDPLFYAIGSDQTVAGTPATLAEAADTPLIYMAPAIAETRVYQLLYQRQPFRLNVSDAFGTLFDVPEDVMRLLIYRAKVLGATELGRNPEAAQIYRSLEKEQLRNVQKKETSTQDVPQIRGPGNMYGGHFRKRRIARGHRIITWK